MSAKQNKRLSMSDTAFAQDLFNEAFPVTRHGSVKAALYAAYRFMSPKLSKDFTPRRARAIRDGKARRIDAEEMAVLKAAQIEGARNEQRELRARLARLDASLALLDAEMAGGALAAKGRQVRDMGRANPS